MALRRLPAERTRTSAAFSARAKFSVIRPPAIKQTNAVHPLEARRTRQSSIMLTSQIGRAARQVDRFQLQVREQAFRSALPADPRLLEAAEWDSEIDLEFVLRK